MTLKEILEEKELINDFDFSAICIEFDKSSARFFYRRYRR